MSDSLGFYSPFLTAEQKAALDRVEEGLREGSAETTNAAIAAFMEIALRLTREALLEQWSGVDLATFEALRDEEEHEAADAFCSLLWNDRELSPFARLLLEPQRSETARTLSVTELKDYLAASVDFYEAHRPVSASGEVVSPGLTWLEPAPAPSLILPGDDESGRWPTLTLAPPTLVAPVNDDTGKTAHDTTEDVTPESEEELREETSAELLFPQEALDGNAAAASQDDRVAASLSDDAAPVSLGRAGQTTETQRPLSQELITQESASEEPVTEVTEPASPARPGEQPQPVARAVAPQPPMRSAEAGEEILEMSAAPLSPWEQKNQLIVKKKYLGYGKNADGVMGYCGKLTLSRFDGQLVSARLTCSSPLLFLSTSSPHGREPVIAYWMPPAAFPQPGGHLTISAGEQTKVLSVGSLFPQSRTDYLSKLQVVLLLLASSLLGLAYFCLVYALSASKIVEQARQIFPEAFAAAQAGSTAVSFRAEGVGLFQLEVVPASESLQLIWAVLIWLCPLLATKLFRHLSRSRQRELGAVLAASLLLPSIGLLGFWHLQKSAFPAFGHPDFAPLDLRYFLAWSLPLNLAVGAYLFLSVHGIWDRKVPSGLRVGLPVVLTALYAVLAFMLIFGRSWTS